MCVFCSKMPLKRLQRTKSHIKTISAVEGFGTHLHCLQQTLHVITQRERRAAQSDLHKTVFYSIVIHEGDWAEPPGAVSPPAERKTLHLLTVSADSVCSETRLSFQPADKLVKDVGHNRQTHVTFLYFFRLVGVTSSEVSGGAKPANKQVRNWWTQTVKAHLHITCTVSVWGASQHA